MTLLFSSHSNFIVDIVASFCSYIKEDQGQVPKTRSRITLTLPNPDDKLIGGTKCIARFDIKAPMLGMDESDPDFDMTAELAP